MLVPELAQEPELVRVPELAQVLALEPELASPLRPDQVYLVWLPNR